MNRTILIALMALGLGVNGIPETYRPAAAAARGSKLGLWSGASPVPPWE